MERSIRLLPLPRLDAFRRRTSGGSDRGFTLVEVLVATAILVGGLVAVAQLLAVTIRVHQVARNSAEASRVAEAKLEELMKLSFATAPAIQITPAGPDPLGQNVANYFDTPANMGSTNVYTRRWSVQAGPTATTRVVTVRVVPLQTRRLTFKTVELTTILRQW